MKEVRRVISPTGTAVLQVPAFYQGATTLEAGPDEADRLRVFQDAGIFRCYTDGDYVYRLQSAGFRVRHVRAIDFPACDIQSYSLKAQVLHVCTSTDIPAEEASGRGIGHT